MPWCQSGRGYEPHRTALQNQRTAARPQGRQFPTLLAKLEVSRSTLKRDLTYLRERLNNPITHHHDLGGYGLYRAHGYISAHLAGQTKFDDLDLELFWDALKNMFEHDHSAARGQMAAQGLYVFKQDSHLGNAPAHALFDRLKVEPKEEGAVARSFDAYSVLFDGQSLSFGQEIQPAAGVTLTRRC
jgi:hypothetical protein